MTIIVIYPGYSVSGGMLSVVKDLDKHLSLDYSDIRYIETHNDKGHWSVGSLVTALLKFIWLLISMKVDVVYVHSASKGSFYRKSLFCLLGFFWCKRVVMHMHGGAFKEFYFSQSCFFKHYISFILTIIVSRLIVLTDGWKNWFEGCFNFKRLPLVVKNSVCELPTTTNNVGTKVVFVGRLVKEKGIFDLLEAVSRLPAHLDIRLDLIGGGDLIDIESFVPMATNRVVFRGELEREDVYREIGSANILVLPSYNEGLPIVILEAMSAGTVVIATRVGGVPEVIEDNVTGILIEPGDINAIEKSIRTLAENPETCKELSFRAKKLWLNSYTFDVNYPLLASALKEEL